MRLKKKNLQTEGNAASLDLGDRDAYVRLFLDEAQWIEIAQGLVAAANALRPQVDAYWANQSARARDSSVRSVSDAPHRIMLMLFSFAIEDLMKAFLIKERQSEYEAFMKARPVLPGELKTHDLVVLATAVGKIRPRFKHLLDRDCEELLRRLTRRATWSGRYPVPVEYPELSGLDQFLDGSSGSLSHKVSTDQSDAMRLIRELCLALGLADIATAAANT